MEKRTDKQLEELVNQILEGIQGGLHRFVEEFREEGDDGHNERTYKLAAIMGSMIATQIVQSMVSEDQYHVVEKILSNKRQQQEEQLGEKADA